MIEAWNPLSRERRRLLAGKGCMLAIAMGLPALASAQQYESPYGGQESYGPVPGTVDGAVGGTVRGAIDSSPDPIAASQIQRSSFGTQTIPADGLPGFTDDLTGPPATPPKVHFEGDP